MSTRKTNTLFMETTSISAVKTVGEISELLIGIKAKQITTLYRPEGAITGMNFVISVEEKRLAFSLPARTQALFETAKKRRGARRMDLAQAERVAWRQVFRWAESQVAFIETGMASPVEVFLPYLLNNQGETLFQAMEAGKFAALPAVSNA